MEFINNAFTTLTSLNKDEIESPVFKIVPAELDGSALTSTDTNQLLNLN